MDARDLVRAATEARDRAHAPYSRYRVGAAVLTRSGRIVSGANVENASYGLTVCAERVALWNAVTQGERELVALAVVTEHGAAPCGACRQVLHELAPSARVFLVALAGTIREV